MDGYGNIANESIVVDWDEVEECWSVYAMLNDQQLSGRILRRTFKRQHGTEMRMEMKLILCKKKVENIHSIISISGTGMRRRGWWC